MISTRHLAMWTTPGFLLAIVLAWTTSGSAGELSFVQYQASASNPGLGGVVDVANSADGANIYTASDRSSDRFADIIGVYTRDPVSGAVTFLEAKEDGVGGVEGLRSTSGVAVSPDGNCVYGTGKGDDKFATFSRSLVTGALTFVGTNDVVAGKAVIVSPDSRHVYVLGRKMDSVLGAIDVFSRTPPACALSFVETETGDTSGFGWLSSSKDFAISADGAHLYAGGSFFDGNRKQAAVNVLSRDPLTGALTFVERQYNGAGGVDLMSSVFAIAVSPDGGSVYVADGPDDSVIVFSRDGVTGTLGFVELQRDGGSVDGLRYATDVVVSPDNTYVFVAGRSDGAVAVFRRDTATGALRFVEVQKDPHIDFPNYVLHAPSAVALSPGGDSLYVAGRGTATFAVDLCGNGNRVSDEQCDDGNLISGDGCSATCRLELCGAAPSAGCRGTLSGGALLRIENLAHDTRDQLQFKWNTGEATTLAEYGDPTTTASYLVCVYDGSVKAQPLLAAAAPAGGLCKSGKVCWKTSSSGYKYSDGLYMPDGLQTLQMKEGLVNGEARLQAKGRGVNLLPPTLPLTLPVTVQVHNTQTGVCFDAVFASADKNDPDSFRAKGD